MGILDKLREAFTGGEGYRGLPNVIDVESANKINPYFYESYDKGKINADELYQLLTKGFVDEWAKPVGEVQGAVAPPEPREVGQLMDNIGMQTVNGYQVYGNPSPALSSWYSSQLPRDESFPYEKGTTYTPAPFVEGAPKNIMDFYANYNYNSNGKGSFKKPLDPGYIQILWNEINQQEPDAPANHKLAFLETILSMTHGESHGGRDAGGLPRVSNVFNMGYSADPGSTLKYDPENIGEMADFEVERARNRFGIMKNKGMTDAMLKSYAPYIPPSEYRKLMNTWHSLAGTKTPW
jgi:hypothetical protein